MSLSMVRSQTTPKHVAHAVVAKFGEEADVAPQFEKVIVQRLFDILAAEVPLELCLRFLGEAHRPRNVRWPPAQDRFSHNFGEFALFRGKSSKETSRIAPPKRPASGEISVHCKPESNRLKEISGYFYFRFSVAFRWIKYNE